MYGQHVSFGCNFFSLSRVYLWEGKSINIIANVLNRSVKTDKNKNDTDKSIRRWMEISNGTNLIKKNQQTHWTALKFIQEANFFSSSSDVANEKWEFRNFFFQHRKLLVPATKRQKNVRISNDISIQKFPVLADFLCFEWIFDVRSLLHIFRTFELTLEYSARSVVNISYKREIKNLYPDWKWNNQSRNLILSISKYCVIHKKEKTIENSPDEMNQGK